MKTISVTLLALMMAACTTNADGSLGFHGVLIAVQYVTEETCAQVLAKMN